MNYDELDPGIRETVRWLRSLGFETSDSGDGVSKIGTDLEACMLPFPHVVICAAPSALVETSDRLLRAVRERGFPVAPVGQEEGSIEISAQYDPSDVSAVIVLTGLSDAKLHAA